jgi:hypothetical protein
MPSKDIARPLQRPDTVKREVTLSLSVHLLLDVDAKTGKYVRVRLNGTCDAFVPAVLRSGHMVDECEL